MPKAKVNRDTNFILQARISGEMEAQGVTIEEACKYAKVSTATLYKLRKEPLKYMPKTLCLLRCLSVPIEDVRAAITYPW